MYLIVGLGNPGLRYRSTRHNAGFMAMDALEEATGIKIKKKQFDGVTGEGTVAGEKVVLLKPHTYMNLSGKSVFKAMQYYKMPVENIIVIYDDIDLALGRLRIRGGGSAGTHNGMRSIISELKTQNFPRVRVGIGKQPPEIALKDYVLMRVKGNERLELLKGCKNAAEAAIDIVKNGVSHAQAEYNGK